MENYHEHLDFCSIFQRLLLDYIPPQLMLEARKAEPFMSKGPLDMLQTYMNHSNNQLKMYGTAEQLYENLKVYSNFPLRHKIYEIRLGYMHNTMPVVFHNLKGESFYCKQEYLLHLQASVYKKNWQYFEEEPPAEVIEFMRNHQKRLDGCFEFVKYNHVIFERILGMFEFSQSIMELKMTPGATVTVTRGPATCTFINPKSFNRMEEISLFQQLIKEYPEMFLPNCQAKSEKVNAAVRIFEEGTEKFVMESELFNAINIKNPHQKPLKSRDTEGYWSTILLKNVFENYRDQIKGIEFLRYPIVNTYHAAVPIPTPSGEHCISASDAFAEIIRRVVFALKVFQKVKGNTWHMIPKYISILEKFFPPDMEYMYFIDLTLIKKLQAETDEFWKPLEQKPAKQVREVGPNGFTLEDVKKELKYLGITDVLPEITSKIKNIKQEIRHMSTKLSTARDMFTWLMECHLMCIYNRFPTLRKFLHYQMLCKTVTFIHCETCEEIKSGSKEVEESKILENKADETFKKVKLAESEEKCEEIKDGCKAQPEKISTNMESVETQEKCVAENVSKIPEKNVSKTDELEIKLKEKEVKIEEMKEINGNEIHENLNSQVDVSKNMLKKKEEQFEEFKNVELVKGEKSLAELEETLAKQLAENHKLKGLLNKYAVESEDLRMKHEKSIESEKSETLRLIGLEKKLENMQKEMEMMKKTSLEDLKKKNAEFQKKCVEAEKAEKKKLLVLGKKLKEAQEETEKIKKKSSEDLKKRDEEIEKLKKIQLQMEKDKKKEIVALKQNVSKSEKLEAENKKLTARITEKEAAEARMKSGNKELTDKIHALEESAEKDQLDMAVKQNQLKVEISERNKVIRELQESSAQQSSENVNVEKKLQEALSFITAQGTAIQGFLGRLTSSESRTSSNTPSTKQEEPKEPSALRCQLLGLQKIKDNLYLNSPLKLALEMKKKLISLSIQPEIHQMAIYEYQQYEGKLRNYQQEVEKKIQLLKKSESDDVTALPSLPEFPSFSDRFIREYWMEIDKQNVSGELQDSECLFCFIEMKSEEKILKCEHCRKVTHLECASKWLKIHRSCPHCRREQLDPNEFPTLQ